MQDTGEIEVDTSEMRAVGRRALDAFGLSAQDASTVLDVLMYAQNRGSSQGLIKIVERTVIPRADATAIGVQHKLPALTHLAGNGNAGMVVMTRAADIAIDNATRLGVAMVSTQGTASSSGAIGYYADRIAKAGLIGIVLAGSPASTALFGGVDPLVGTNPIAIAVPGLKDNLIFDMATAATTVFGLIAARDAGESIASDLAVDPAGNATNDPDAALSGAIRAFGGTKGSGLAMMFEILTNVLAGASIAGEDTDNRGNFLLAINPDGTIGQQAFGQRLERFCTTVLSSRPSDPDAPLRLPGQGSQQRAATAARTGRTRINSRTWTQLQELSKMAC